MCPFFLCFSSFSFPPCNVLLHTKAPRLILICLQFFLLIRTLTFGRAYIFLSPFTPFCFYFFASGKALHLPCLSSSLINLMRENKQVSTKIRCEAPYSSMYCPPHLSQRYKSFPVSLSAPKNSKFPPH